MHPISVSAARRAGGFTVCRQVDLSLASIRTKKFSCNEPSVERMLKCLVTGSLIKPEAIRVCANSGFSEAGARPTQ